MNAHKRFPMPIPFGWFVVAYSDELSPGQAKPVKYFGMELVLFRTEGGTPALVEAYCPHLGAHLGYGIHEHAGAGGKIEGENIVCPFHSWKFNKDGFCTEVPYATNMPPKVKSSQCLRSFPMFEANQVVYAWYHPAREAPLWEPEIFEETCSDGWGSLDKRAEWILKTHIQEFSENSVDTAHFQYVHRTLDVPNMKSTFDGRLSSYISSTHMKTPKGDVEAKITARGFGPGVGTVRFEGIADTLVFSHATPIDEDTTHIRFAFTHPKGEEGGVKSRVHDALFKDICKQIDEDTPIWEHKKYRPSPTLCDGDGAIAKFRKHFGQFYADYSEG